MTNQSSPDEPSEETDALAHDVIGAAIEVHRHLGPGFLESVYEEALCKELTRQKIPYERQAELQVIYKGDEVGQGLADLIVDNRIVLELKTVSALAKIHRAQTHAYLKAANLKLGLLINFNVTLLKDGVKRIINSNTHGS